MDVRDMRVEQCGTIFASLYEQTADRVAVNACHALCAADAISFKQGCDYGEFLSGASMFIWLAFLVRQADNGVEEAAIPACRVAVSGPFGVDAPSGSRHLPFGLWWRRHVHSFRLRLASPVANGSGYRVLRESVRLRISLRLSSAEG